MQTRSLKTLTHIARLNSFARAAEEMGTTLSTISMQIKSLETELGVELFDRQFRPPKLTALGREVVKQAETLLLCEEAIHSLCDSSEDLRGVYRLGFVATASVRLLPRFLKRSKQLAPLAEFQFETALSEVLEERVLSGQLDAAVVTASHNPLAGLEYMPLEEEKIVFAYPPGVDTKRPASSSLPFLQFNPGSGIGKYIEQYRSEMEVQDSKRDIVLDSVEAIMECVNAGLGYTLLSEPDVSRYARDDVQIIEPNNQRMSRTLALVVRKNFKPNSGHGLLAIFGPVIY